MATRRFTAFLLALLTACSGTPHVIPSGTDSRASTVLIPRTGEVEPVELNEDAFAEAMEALARQVRPSERPLESARRLFGVSSRSGSYRYEAGSQRVVPDEEGVEVARGRASRATVCGC